MRPAQAVLDHEDQRRRISAALLGREHAASVVSGRNLGHRGGWAWQCSCGRSGAVKLAARNANVGAEAHTRAKHPKRSRY